jgi:UDP-glucose 4-epimerase
VLTAGFEEVRIFSRDEKKQDGAVDLVRWTFDHGNPGDIFVQKALAATIQTLALAIKQVFNAGNTVQVIGTRHGEKLYETLGRRSWGD